MKVPVPEVLCVSTGYFQDGDEGLFRNLAPADVESGEAESDERDGGDG